jgi:hypothetical protein
MNTTANDVNVTPLADEGHVPIEAVPRRTRLAVSFSVTYDAARVLRFYATKAAMGGRGEAAFGVARSNLWR